MSHACKNLIIHCIDFRLVEDTINWMESKELIGDADEVSVAGAIKDLVASDWPSKREFILEQIRISHDLHNIRRVIVIHHTDCGAYEGHEAFQSETEEEQKHINDMKTAADIIKTRWPELEIMLVLIKMTNATNEFVEIK